MSVSSRYHLLFSSPADALMIRVSLSLSFFLWCKVAWDRHPDRYAAEQRALAEEEEEALRDLDMGRLMEKFSMSPEEALGG